MKHSCTRGILLEQRSDKRQHKHTVNGLDAELKAKDYRDLLTGGEKWLKEFEEKEKEKTGCKFLKVGYNKIFGF